MIDVFDTVGIPVRAKGRQGDQQAWAFRYGEADDLADTDVFGAAPQSVGYVLYTTASVVAGGQVGSARLQRAVSRYSPSPLASSHPETAWEMLMDGRMDEWMGALPL